MGEVKLATILASDEPGAFVIDFSSATKQAAFSHMPLKMSSESPISFHEIERGKAFSFVQSPLTLCDSASSC